MPVTIANNESGLSVRTKLNAALADLETAQSDIAAIDAALVPIQSNIATNTADIATNAADIAANTADIATNAANIATNTADIATNAAAIAALPQATVPSQTEPTSPAVGQRWIEINGQGLILGEWQWTGSVWVSLQKIVRTEVLWGTSIFLPFRYSGRPVLIESLDFMFWIPGPVNDAANYYLAKIRNNTANGGATLLGTYPVTNDATPLSLLKKTIPVNSVVNFAANGGDSICGVDVSWEKFGNPSNLPGSAAIAMNLREVRG